MNYITQKHRSARAWAMLSMSSRGITVARAMKSEKAAEEIAKAVKAAAIKAAGQAQERK